MIPDLLHPNPFKTEQQIWAASANHTKLLYPSLLAIQFITGHNTNCGIDADKPSTNRNFEPHLACTQGKTNSLDIPEMAAEIDNKVPMARGERPRPPSFIGVERYSTSVCE